MNPPPDLGPRGVAIIGVVFAASIGALLYLHLGREALADWDEGIYAELGRSLLATGNLFVPSWNGSPWFEKPPGIAWASALGQMLGGVSAQGARLLMPIMAACLLYVVYRLGTHLRDWRSGLLAAGALATFQVFLARTRVLNADLPLLVGIATTVLLLVENRSPLWVAATITACVWFKGAAGLLAVMVSVPLFLDKPRGYWARVAGVTLLLSLPWHLFAYARFRSEFLTPYLLEQVVKRFNTPIEFHFESRWYYFRFLYQTLGPVVLFLIVLGGLSSAFKVASGEKRALHLTLLTWLLIPLAIFTLAQTRLLWYILPIFPALALLIAEAFTRWQRGTAATVFVTLVAIGFCAWAVQAASLSVEIGRASSPVPDRIAVATELGQTHKGRDLLVLVPPSERRSEAVLPSSARLSSSFRYGGMPALVFYYRGRVKFFYNIEDFRRYWSSHDAPGMISTEDLELLPPGYQVIRATGTYLGIAKGRQTPPRGMGG